MSARLSSAPVALLVSTVITVSVIGSNQGTCRVRARAVTGHIGVLTCRGGRGPGPASVHGGRTPLPRGQCRRAAPRPRGTPMLATGAATTRGCGLVRDQLDFGFDGG